MGGGLLRVQDARTAQQRLVLHCADRKVGALVQSVVFAVQEAIDEDLLKWRPELLRKLEFLLFLLLFAEGLTVQELVKGLFDFILGIQAIFESIDPCSDLPLDGLLCQCVVVG